MSICEMLIEVENLKCRQPDSNLYFAGDAVEVLADETMKNLGIGLLATLYLFVLPNAFATTQTCTRLQKSSQDELISYLKTTHTNIAGRDCIAFAVTRLGEQNYEPAVPVLIQFIDFNWPQGTWQKQRYFPDRPNPSDIHAFPAVAALQKMGSKALPAVLAEIRNGPPVRRGRDGLITVWMSYFAANRPQGVALLKQEAAKATDPGTKLRFNIAAIKAAGWCGPNEIAACEATAMAGVAKPRLEAKTQPGSTPK